MEKKITFKVFDKDGNDVTNTQSWYIDTYGNLYCETNDIDCPMVATFEFDYKIEMQ